ncbi:MAG: hypothetical protein ACFHWX_08615 [Bacteroidota bacterium]
MKVLISYQTLQLPPPYSFAYTLDLNIDHDLVTVKFQQEYLNRDTLTEEEILNENFTLDDDHNWTGTLGKVWADYLGGLFEDVSVQEIGNDDRLYIHMAIGNNKPGVVIDTDFWDYELQELVQAIYEASKRELKMHLDYIVVDDGQKSITLDASFEERKARLHGDQPVSWDDFRKIMSLTYVEDYGDKGSKNPGKDGIWVDFDGSKEYYIIQNKSVQNELLDLIM